MYKVITFYRYVSLNDTNKVINKLKHLCKKLMINGRVLLGEEGINGGVSGTIENIETFKKEIESIFPNLTYREQNSKNNPYHKLVLRERDEIVAFGEKVNISNTGNHIKPKEFKEMLDNKEDIIVLDARNDYEFKVGKFTNAIDLDITNFRDFGKKVNKLEEYKDKKIVMYCTGGIRCEKASAFLKEKGFSNVNQLEGGIIAYDTEFPKTHFEGSCFVFDNRKTSRMNNPISECKICNEKTDEITNCHNIDCDKLFVCCTSCQEKMNSCCNEECKNSPKQRPKKEIKKVIGKVINYYAKPKIAYVELFEEAKDISIKGKTTKEFNITLNNPINEEGETRFIGKVTFPISSKVRKNDLVLV